MATATAIKNTIEISYSETLPNGVDVLTLHCGDSSKGCYSFFKKLPLVVEFEGKRYAKTGFNSDRFLAYYRTDAMARIGRPLR